MQLLELGMMGVHAGQAAGCGELHGSFAWCMILPCSCRPVLTAPAQALAALLGHTHVLHRLLISMLSTAVHLQLGPTACWRTACLCRFSSNAAAEDTDVQFRVWAIKSAVKRVPLYVQVW